MTQSEWRNLARAHARHAHPVPQPCIKDCGRMGTERHHHRGYDREHWTDTVWLCRPCHDVITFIGERPAPRMTHYTLAVGREKP